MSSILDELIKELHKKYSESIVMPGSDDKLRLVRFSTNITALDSILGGGIPLGRNLLIYGDYSAGKTYLAQMIIKAAQSQNLTTAFIDVEKTYDIEWFRKSGIDVDSLLVCRPAYGEEALDLAIYLIKSEVNVVVLDSVAALVSTQSAEESTENKKIGELARLFNDGLRKITVANHHGKSVFIAINQPRAGIGGYIPTEALPAGKGQWFFSSIILRVSRGPFIKEKENGKEIKKGFIMRVSTEKNKTFHPFQSCELPFDFLSGAIDMISGAVEIAIDCKIIIQKGPYFYYDGEKYRGKGDLVDYFKNNPEVLSKLKLEIREK